MLSLKRELSHVYWICGSPCAGKSAAARLLAQDLNLVLYSTDEHAVLDHFRRATPCRQPFMWGLRDLADRYYDRSPLAIVEHSLGYLAEEFVMVLEDLRRMSQDRPVIAEGICLLPELVNRVADYGRVVCLVPGEEFYRTTQPLRPFTAALLRSHPDPLQARENMTEAHLGLARHILESARAAGFRIFVTGERDSIQRNVEILRDHFRLSS